MILSWWFDVILLFTVAVLVYVAIKLHRQSFQPGADFSEVELPHETATGRSVYPRKLIRQCGILPDDFQLSYWAIKCLLAVFLPLTLLEFEVASSRWYFYVAAGLGGFFLLDYFLWQQRRKRQAKIEANLSYFVDLIVAFLNSGMTLSQAFEASADHGLPLQNPLAKEVRLVSRELSAGMDRPQGFLKLAERTGVDALNQLAAVLNVGFQSGSAVGDVLTGQSELLRIRQWERGAELINKKSMQSLFPMALVSIPLIMVLIFFPAMIQMLEAFSLFRAAFS